MLHNNLGVTCGRLKARRRRSTSSTPASRSPPPADSPRSSTARPPARSARSSTRAGSTRRSTLAGTLADHLDDDPTTSSDVRTVQARIYALRGKPTSSRLSRLAGNHQPRRRQTGSLVFGPGSSRHRPRRARRHQPRRHAPHRTRAAQDTRDNPYYAALPPDARPNRLAIDRPDIAHELSPPTTSPAPPTPTTPSSPPPPPSPKPTATTKPPPTATPTPPTLGPVRRHPRTRIRPTRPRPLPHPPWPTTRSRAVLHHARALFAHLGATPALAETDTLLEQAAALSS